MSTVTVSNGSSYNVSNGQTDTDDAVLSGGSMFVLSGGVADATTVDGRAVEQPNAEIRFKLLNTMA